MSRLVVEHRRAPSAMLTSARILLGSLRPSQRTEFQDLVQRWTGVRVGGKHETRFHEATGRDAGCVLYPHVLGFPLHMAVLTHPAFPLPLWKALQIRNRLVRHRPPDRNADYTFETSIGERRVVEKGVEVDLRTRLATSDRCDWESTVTYFYPGRFKLDSLPVAPPASPDLSQASELARFRTPNSGGWTFAGLTGDYNGIHWSAAYARRFGFKSAFLHSQRTVGLCLAHLGLANEEPGTLTLWLKGPVFYDTEVILSAVREASGNRFGLALNGDPRHAIAGSWSPAVM